MECPFSGKLSLFLIFGPIIGSKRVLSRQIIMGHAMWYGKQSKQVRHSILLSVRDAGRSSQSATVVHIETEI